MSSGIRTLELELRTLRSEILTALAKRQGWIVDRNALEEMLGRLSDKAVWLDLSRRNRPAEPWSISGFLAIFSKPPMKRES